VVLVARALLDKHGLQVPYTTKFSKKAVAWMRELSLGFIDDAILLNDLAVLEVLDEQISYVEEKLVALLRGRPPGTAADDHDRGRLLRRDTHYKNQATLDTQLQNIKWFRKDQKVILRI